MYVPERDTKSLISLYGMSELIAFCCEKVEKQSSDAWSKLRRDAFS